MKFAIVRPGEQRVQAVSAGDINIAVQLAGLSMGELDFGIVSPVSKKRPGLAVTVYEFGLCKMNKRTGKNQKPLPMFGLGQQLYAGNAVLYSFDEEGETVDLAVGIRDIARDIIWLPDQKEAEKAIMSNLVLRPVQAINGVIMAAWPNL